MRRNDKNLSRANEQKKERTKRTLHDWRLNVPIHYAARWQIHNSTRRNGRMPNTAIVSNNGIRSSSNVSSGSSLLVFAAFLFCFTSFFVRRRFALVLLYFSLFATRKKKQRNKIVAHCSRISMFLCVSFDFIFLFCLSLLFCSSFRVLVVLTKRVHRVLCRVNDTLNYLNVIAASIELRTNRECVLSMHSINRRQQRRAVSHLFLHSILLCHFVCVRTCELHCSVDDNEREGEIIVWLLKFSNSIRFDFHIFLLLLWQDLSQRQPIPLMLLAAANFKWVHEPNCIEFDHKMWQEERDQREINDKTSQTYAHLSV